MAAESSVKRLFIVDSMALAFRSFYAFGGGGGRALTAPQTGLPIGAVFGSAMFLNKLISEQRPDYLAFALDTAEPTFRHQLYPAYKANRVEMPAELAAQLPDFFRLLAAYGCPVLKSPGHEADDLIGAVAQRFAAPDRHVFIVSGDKDFMQLVNPRVSLFIPKKGDDAQIVDAAGVREKFGVDPEQVVDCLALIGDTSDNVPGVKGIGEKGAAKLIQTYGSLDGIYAHLDQIANEKQRRALAEQRDTAYLSQRLVTIDCQVDPSVALEGMAEGATKAVANQELLAVYQEFGFRTLSSKMEAALGKEQVALVQQPDAPPVASPAIDTTPAAADPAAERIADQTPGYRLISSKAELDTMIAAIGRSLTFAFDTETTGLDVVASVPIGISFAVRPSEAWYLPLATPHLRGDLQAIGTAGILELLKPLLTSSSRLKVGHHVKFDLQMLANVGIIVAGPFADTMIADWLLDSSARSHGLDACCLRHLNYEKIKTTTLIGPRGELPMIEADLAELSRYGCEDADLTLRLHETLLPRLTAAGMRQAFETIEMPLVPILANMERTGVHVDVDVLTRLGRHLKAECERLTAKAYELAGSEFNLNSTKQVAAILFERLKVQEQLGIKGLKKTKSGYSTDEAVLSRLTGHPLPQTILDFRSVAKLRSTYVEALPALINPKSGRIHTSFHQTGTATGRLSSSDPNLQNIPIRSDLGQEIRTAFRPREADWVMLSADYSQIELRVLAHLAGEANLARAFAADLDIHRATAARVFGVREDEVDGEMRSRAKAINFGIIYGMGPRRLAAETGTSVAEATTFIDRYFASYPGIGRFVEATTQQARSEGVVRTIAGRTRSLRALQEAGGRQAAMAENVAVNSRIQGSAADLIKAAMIAVDRALTEARLSARLLLQVHDELVFETPRSESDRVLTIVREAMEHAMVLSVPLRVEAKIGAHWLEAH